MALSKNNTKVDQADPDLSLEEGSEDVVSPVKKFTRNKVTGLVEGISYPYDENGLVDWRKLIPTKFLYIHKEKLEEATKKFPDAVEEKRFHDIDDKYLCVMLGGLNYIATLRGYKSIKHEVPFNDSDKATCICTMEFIPNDENPEGLTVSGVASGSKWNINTGFEKYMETFAENRALARAIRRALRINMVSSEEIADRTRNMPIDEAPPAPPVQGIEPWVNLKTVCEKRSITLEKVRSAAMVTKEADSKTGKATIVSDPTAWKDWSDIPPADVWTIQGKIKEGKSS
jgi:hypothetical protein